MSVSAVDFEIALLEALDAHVGNGKRWTRAKFAAETGIPVKRLDRIRQGDQLPSGLDLVRMAAVLPAVFTDHVLAVAKLGNVTKIGGPRKVSEFDVHKKASEHAAAFAACLTDHRSPGRIDEFELKLIKRSAEELRSSINAFLAEQEAA